MSNTGDLGKPIAGGDSAVPPSQVADVEYPNVPATTAPQQGASGPGQGTTFGDSSSAEKVPFKEQVNGFAKKFAGQVFGNKEEKELGEQKLQGDA